MSEGKDYWFKRFLRLQTAKLGTYMDTTNKPGKGQARHHLQQCSTGREPEMESLACTPRLECSAPLQRQEASLVHFLPLFHQALLLTWIEEGRVLTEPSEYLLACIEITEKFLGQAWSAGRELPPSASRTLARVNCRDGCRTDRGRRGGSNLAATRPRVCFMGGALEHNGSLGLQTDVDVGWQVRRKYDL